MWRSVLWLVLAGLVVLVAAAGFIRLAPDDPRVWHVDPLEAPRTGRPNAWRVAPPGALVQIDAAAPVYALGASDLAQAFDARVQEEPRTTRLAGRPSGLWATYIVRSRHLRFPDYVSVRFLDLADGASTLAIYSRARYGRSDLGVNRARVENWLAALRAFER